MRNHNHYFKDVSHLFEIDIYRILELFEVDNPCIQHAVKKLLCSGVRGIKDEKKDIQEAIDTLIRYQDMRMEDTSKIKTELNNLDLTLNAFNQKKQVAEMSSTLYDKKAMDKIRDAIALDLEQQLGRSESTEIYNASIRDGTSHPVTGMQALAQQNAKEQTEYYQNRELKI